MKRRNFIQTTGLSIASVLMSDLVFAFGTQQRNQLLNFPNEVSAIVNGKKVLLSGRNSQIWTFQDVIVNLKKSEKSISVEIEAPKVKLSSVTLYWHFASKKSATILNDHWERTYGDISWHKPNDSEILPWYFIENDGKSTNGFGVKTGAKSFCFWQIENNKLSLTLDTRSGGDGVQLGDRKLQAAEIVTLKSKSNESTFQASKRFMTVMCDKARMPKQPVYGINDWYFSYGNNSEKLILEHTELMAPMAEGLSNRPFSVIDAGWFQNPPSFPNDCCWGDNMDTPDEKFGDMEKLAEKITKLGMRPGIWTRPLCGSYKDKLSLLLPMINGREEKKPVLDPTIPENLERVKNYFKLYNQWNYEMVKFDFTSFDIFGKWGFEMVKGEAMSVNNWAMYDSTKTNAEIVLNLYQTIRDAAGETYLIGCNTFSHLSAGLFELNRIGDDTSGNEWDRTRKMGVNTLAFRGIQQGSFYAADGDCVGLTSKISWERNRQWMELLSKSGTPLFISAQPDATGFEQKAFIKKCFEISSKEMPVAEPLDWMNNAFPTKWKAGSEILNFNWD
jgi:alpha-galactosidase